MGIDMVAGQEQGKGRTVVNKHEIDGPERSAQTIKSKPSFVGINKEWFLLGLSARTRQGA